MIDYERYDHTYCRVVAEDEDVVVQKIGYSAPSEEVIVVNNYALQTKVTTEKENGAQLNREPVIISRTKRPRKATPIIVKAVNRDGETLRVSTVIAPATVSAVSAVSTASTNAVHSIVRKVAPANNLDVCVENFDSDNSQQASDSVPAVSKDKVNDSSTTPPPVKTTVAPKKEEVAPLPEITQTTKSGRTRKLTAKAKQNSEDLRKVHRTPKPVKAKGSSSGDSTGVKKRRGRPPTNKAKIETASTTESAEQPSATDQPDLKSTSEPVQPLQIEGEGPTKNDTEDGTKATQKKKAAQPLRVAKKPGRKPSAKTSLTKLSPQQASAKNKNSKANALLAAKLNSKSRGPAKLRPASKTPPKRNKKQSSKTSKLVVVTKPPPRRRGQPDAPSRADISKSNLPRKRKQASHDDQSIPSAKIDAGNIVGGSRRRN